MEGTRKHQGNKTEYCVCCGAPTDYVFDTPIKERQDYVSGAGQLCPKCAAELRSRSERLFADND